MTYGVVATEQAAITPVGSGTAGIVDERAILPRIAACPRRRVIQREHMEEKMEIMNKNENFMEKTKQT